MTTIENKKLETLDL